MDFHITREVKPYSLQKFNKGNQKEERTELKNVFSSQNKLQQSRSLVKTPLHVNCFSPNISPNEESTEDNDLKGSVDSKESNLFSKKRRIQNEIGCDNNSQSSSFVKTCIENNGSKYFVRPSKTALIHKRLDSQDLEFVDCSKRPQETKNFKISSDTTVVEYVKSMKWDHITRENFDVNYAIIFSKEKADIIFQRLEHEVQYFSGELVKLQVFGKWHQIPRKWVSYGDEGLTYAFSGTCLPALPWNPLLLELKNAVQHITGQQFNFVLVNRYKDGKDYIGEHRDDEKDLVADAAIVSLSFGASRDFIFKHKDSRGAKATRKIDQVKLILEHGSLLMMNSPTNKFWYHSLPVRKKVKNVRVNLTFRKMVLKKVRQ